MVERKTKRADKEQEKKTQKKAVKKVEKKVKIEEPVAVKAEKSTRVKKEPEKSKVGKVVKQEFIQRKLPKHEEERIPAWLVILFSFSLAFLLFSIYKTFIYWRGYDIIPNNSVEQVYMEEEPGSEQNIINTDSEYVNLDEENSDYQEVQIVESNTNPVYVENGKNNDWFDIQKDVQFIQDFYSYLVNDDTENMDSLVDYPLLNSSTWKTHWSKKNISTFTKHLNTTVSLDNINFVEGSDNQNKHTRKYKYIFSYSMDNNDSFTEDWEVTLLSRDWRTLISEIMCKTEWCSRSPFFWPQNYESK